YELFGRSQARHRARRIFRRSCAEVATIYCIRSCAVAPHPRGRARTRPRADHSMRLSRILCILAIGVANAPANPVAAQQRGAVPPRAAPPLDPFRFQMMGPAEGGRIASITGVPGDPRVWYVGAASGGVWKSIDSGATFRPVFDSMRVQAIGALAVAPSKPSIVWAGTGEAWAIRDADLMGDGVYKSTDSGTTWTHMGLPETGRIQRILVHPTN